MNVTEADAANIPFYKAVGCEKCNQTGYRGRVGIYEVMTVTDKLRRLIAQRASEDAIREAAQLGGMRTLGEDALAKVKAGLDHAGGAAADGDRSQGDARRSARRARARSRSTSWPARTAARA